MDNKLKKLGGDIERLVVEALNHIQEVAQSDIEKPAQTALDLLAEFGEEIDFSIQLDNLAIEIDDIGANSGEWDAEDEVEEACDV